MSNARRRRRHASFFRQDDLDIPAEERARQRDLLLVCRPEWTLRFHRTGGAKRRTVAISCAVCIRMRPDRATVLSLSGGNQQKVSLTRPFLRGDVKVILAEEPTHGVDVAARFDIYEALRAKAEEGVAVIVKSSDPLELAGLCDRVVVMSRGKIVAEIPREELGERRIVEAIVGLGTGAARRAGEGEALKQ